MRRLMLILLAAMFTLVVGTTKPAGAAMARFEGVQGTYDAPGNSRVEAQCRGQAAAAISHVDDTWEGSVSRSSLANDRSMTPFTPVVATKAETRIADDVVAAGDDAFTHG